MDSSDAVRLLILLVLIMLSAFFSSAETCLTTVNKVRMQTMAGENIKNAALVLRLTKNPTRLLSSILIGNNVVNLTASSLTTSFSLEYAQQHHLSTISSAIGGISTTILTILILIFGEIVPKSLAAANAEKLSLSYAKLVYVVIQILSPIAFIMNAIANLFLHLFHIDPSKNPVITEDELLTMVAVSHKEGVIESEEKKMINNVVDFGDSLAKDIMVPKRDVGFVSIDLTYSELIEAYQKEKFTRMPVYRDSRDNILGIINLKDIFFYQDSPENFQVSDVMREPYFTYEYKKSSELFFEMKKNSIPMAIVLDEYGSTSGILTIEDLIEEIVGDIRDEYDANEENEIEKIDASNYVILGTAKLEEIDEKLGISIESDEYDSIAGHIINLLDHFPVTGESVKDSYAEYTVLKATKKCIEKVKLHLLPQKELSSDAITDDSKDIDE